ncbi:hypothetical protein [Streptomyces huasconensis]|uniref:hypothetical protein n=1 Tax=Streptomyces huasconensis TaxID=1854574 RepID=UPI0036F5656E
MQPEAPRAGLPVDEVVDDVTGALRETPPPARWVPGPPLPPTPPLPGSGDGAGPGRDADPAPGATPAPTPTPLPEPAPEPASEPASEGGARDGDGSGPGREHRAERSAGAWAESPYAAVYGLPGYRADAHSGADEAMGEHGAGHVPLPFAPGGSLGNATAVDGNTSRHGDQHAAALDSRAPVRLLAGPGRPAASAPIRDRHRDIPEFPG